MLAPDEEEITDMEGLSSVFQIYRQPWQFLYANIRGNRIKISSGMASCMAISPFQPASSLVRGGKHAIMTVSPQPSLHPIP
jgi:hypothetical protein